MACVISSVVPIIAGSITLLLVSNCESWGNLQSKKSESAMPNTFLAGLYVVVWSSADELC